MWRLIEVVECEVIFPPLPIIIPVLLYATIWTVTPRIKKKLSQGLDVFLKKGFFSFVCKVVEKGCRSVFSPNIIAIVSSLFICVSYLFINSEIKCNGMDGRCAYAGMSIVFSSTSSSTFWVWPFCFYLPDGQTGWISTRTLWMACRSADNRR